MSSPSELIQWKAAEMRGNKAYHGFGGFIFLVFELFLLRGLLCPPDLHLLLMIAVIVKRYV